jgi:hypothetical protein
MQETVFFCDVLNKIYNMSNVAIQQQPETVDGVLVVVWVNVMEPPRQEGQPTNSEVIPHFFPF